VVDDETLGDAFGAYAMSTDAIYLGRRFLDTATRETIRAVVLEEIGHHADGYLNETDSAGDEGELFSNVVRGVNLPDTEVSRLQSEDDSAAIFLEVQTIPVEKADPIIPRVTTTADENDGSATMGSGLSLRTRFLSPTRTRIPTMKSG
jgi:hypothetical protein